MKSVIFFGKWNLGGGGVFLFCIRGNVFVNFCEFNVYFWKILLNNFIFYGIFINEIYKWINKFGWVYSFGK